jgi:hypothetical protein
MSRRVEKVTQLVALIALLEPIPVFAQAVSARQIADGKPWAMNIGPQGRETTETLNHDGTGRMEKGPMTMSPNWRATAGGICLKVWS